MLTRFLFSEVFDEIEHIREVQNHTNLKMRYLMSALTDLRAEVAAEKAEFAAGVAKIQELETRLEAVVQGTSDEDLASVVAEMKSNSAALAAAVAPKSAPVETPVEASVANTEVANTASSNTEVSGS